MTNRTRTATAFFAAITSALLLVGCGGPVAPEVADLSGKTFEEAKKDAIQAGYGSEFGVNGQSANAYTAPGSTNNYHEREFDEDDPAHFSWTVCSQDPSDLSSEKDGSDWVLFLYLVEKPSDCEGGEITAEARERYVAIAKQGKALATEPTADDTSDIPTEDSYRTIDDPDFTYTGDFTLDTGLPDPQERDAYGSYRYSLCEGSDYATASDCYPTEWQRVYEEYREEYN
ncbi:hypothetical protein EES43_29845 [Streptomyces sp. ADI96-02]|uniref:hypothetical protein n=1 Tax=Streptomyces TaxID=1883 RepID=UPI000F551340|nr:hypothetical protein [Streptomyces sp. ADI96-02]RPK54005.1 hypothetical protein EES43_29845 [Streptomyces sp. ADI96-02]